MNIGAVGRLFTVGDIGTDQKKEFCKTLQYLLRSRTARIVVLKR
jgi:hypothetical protein